MTEKDAALIAKALVRDARDRFGDERTAELEAALTQMAAELYALEIYPIGLDDEP